MIKSWLGDNNGEKLLTFTSKLTIIISKQRTRGVNYKLLLGRKSHDWKLFLIRIIEGSLGVDYLK